jgi:hypothetical protein
MPDRNAASNPVVLVFLTALVSACSSSLAGGPSDAPADGSSSGGTSSGGSSSGGSSSGGTSSGGTSSGGTSSGGTSSGGPSSGGTTDCISDRVKPPSDGSCACAWDNCDATSMSCKCGLTCYGDGDKKCIISVNPDGNASTNDSTLGNCTLSCSPEDDLSTEITCSAKGCEIQPNNNVNINPVAPAAPPPTSFDAERKIQAVDVVFVVDNSLSMQDNQMASACALDSFFNAAGKNGAKYDTGVMTTDMVCEKSSCTPVYSRTEKKYVNPSTLVSVDGTCASSVSCSSNSCQNPDLNGQVCHFGESGKLVPSDDTNAQQQLQQLIVQGDKGSQYEGGLEKSFQLFAEQERKGTFDINTPKEIIVISDENADADNFLCPFNSVDRNTSGIPNFTPPTPTNTSASCKQDLTDFYTYYFKTRNVIVHGLLYTDDCSNNSTEETGSIYQAVIKATGGHEGSICHCEDFNSFFDDVGKSTSTLSTELCFSGALPDPSTIQVVHVDKSGAEKTVPQSAQDGWTLDQSLKCLVMNGSWKDQYGKFHIVYTDPSAKPVPTGEPKACLQSTVDPIVSTIQVSCNGKDVPRSDTDGYTYNPADHCFTFHGSNWAGVDGSTCTVKFI